MPKRKQTVVKSNAKQKKATMGSVLSDDGQDDPRREELPDKHIPRETLEAYGYHFKNEKFVSIDDDEPFQFNVYSNPEENQKRYEAIGKLVDQAVFEMLQHRCGLTRVTIPKDAREGEPVSFIFVSKNMASAKYLMIIIHGTGVVRAGQWSRKLIMNESLTVGSQIQYINRAQAAGYAVIVTNTNLNGIESPRQLRHSKIRPIRGSSTPEEHGAYVWTNFVQNSTIDHICIMAHSYGGAVLLSLAQSFTKDFEERVFAIALTDSPVSVYGRRMKPKLLEMLKKKTINWIADTETVDTELGEDDCCLLRSAGHSVHEWTSHSAIDAIFKYFAEKRSQLK